MTAKRRKEPATRRFSEHRAIGEDRWSLPPALPRLGLAALGVLALVLLVIGPCGSAQRPMDPAFIESSATLEMRLLHTIYAGVPTGITVNELLDIASPATEEPRAIWVLARCALTVLGEDRGWPEYPIERLLADDLRMLQRFETDDLLAGNAPVGFGRDDLLSTELYALAVTGQTTAAEEVLEAALDHEASWVQARALQLLFDLGTGRAGELIQRATERRDEVWIVAHNLVRYSRFPTLAELGRHWNLIPLAERSRAGILFDADEACSPRAVLALYLLGYLPAAEPREERREIERLEQAVRRLPPQGCFNGRYFAERSLGLRQRRSVLEWELRIGEEPIHWARALMVQMAFAQHGADFVGAAQRLVVEEPMEFVRWELLAGLSLVHRPDVVFRDTWDVWTGSPHHQMRLSYPANFAGIPKRELASTLDWLEEANPLVDHPKQLLFVLREVANGADGSVGFRLLRFVATHPRRDELLDVMWSVSDPRLAPFLRFAAREFAHDPDQRGRLEEALERMEEREANLATGRRRKLCCDPTEACLRTQFEDQVLRLDDPLKDEQEAREWLERGSIAGDVVGIRFLDRARRTALVRDIATGLDHRFEHRFACWRLID